MSCYHLIDEITQKILDKLPPKVGLLKKSMEKTIHTAVQSVFSQLNIVTQDEFNKKCQSLKYYEKKIMKLEQKITELEQKIINQQSLAQENKS